MMVSFVLSCILLYLLSINKVNIINIIIYWIYLKLTNCHQQLLLLKVQA